MAEYEIDNLAQFIKVAELVFSGKGDTGWFRYKRI